MFKLAKVNGVNSDNEAVLSAVSGLHTSTVLLIAVAAKGDDAFLKCKQSLTLSESIFFNQKDAQEGDSDSSSGASPDSLQDSFDQVCQTLSKLQDVNLLLAAIREDDTGRICYLIRQGEMFSISLKRGKRTIVLSEKLPDHQLVSGFLEEGDRVVVASDTAKNFLDRKFESIIQSDIDAIEDEVNILLPQAQPMPLTLLVLENELPETYETKPLNAKSSKPVRWLVKLPVISRKKLVYLSTVVVFIFLASFIFRIFSGKLQTLNKSGGSGSAGDIQQARIYFEQATQLESSDQKAAVEKIGQAKQQIVAILKNKPDDAQAKQLSQKIEDKREELTKVYRIGEIPLWLDLDLAKKGINSERLNLSGGKILVADTGQKLILTINTASKATQIVAGSDRLGQLKFASINNGFVRTFSDDLGINSIDAESKQVTPISKKDQEWGEISDVAGYGGNTYLLDRTKNQIWKYLPIANGFSDKQPYFKDGSSVNLTSASRIYIDSAVWILKGGGKIDKYLQGVRDSFSLSGLDEPINNIKAIYVSDETDMVYILDWEQNRLVVLDKKGLYQAQYLSDRLSSFNDFVVDEPNKKVYLLMGSKIFLMNLK